MVENIKRYLVVGDPSGTVQSAKGITDIGTPSVGVLTSYWYYKSFDFSRLADVPLVLDSGAFSAYTSGGEVKAEDYGKWAASLAPRWDFAFNLDVLGDAEASLRNWKVLHDLGVRTVPVIHFGDKPQEVLPAYLAQDDPPDRIALGGIAVSGAGEQVVGWCAYVFRWLRDNAPHVRTHGLGVHLSSTRMARLPWDTTDSSSFTMAWRFARLRLFTLRNRWITVPLDGKSLYRYGKDIRSYGVEPSEVATSRASNRSRLIELATRIEVRAADYYNEKSGRNVTRFLVDGGTGNLETAARVSAHLQGK